MMISSKLYYILKVRLSSKNNFHYPSEITKLEMYISHFVIQI